MMGEKLTIEIVFEKFDEDKHMDVDFKSGIAQLKDGSVELVGEYNVLGGVCDCCKKLEEENIERFALVDLDKIKNQLPKPIKF